MSTEVCPIRVDGTYCGEPAAFRVIGMCVHEHRLGGPCCVSCVEAARRLFLDGQQGCIPCRDGEHSHTCLVQVEIVPVGVTYECSACHGAFTSEWSEEEARAEQEALWEPVPGDDEDSVIVCDDCFQRVVARAQVEAPEVFRRRS